MIVVQTKWFLSLDWLIYLLFWILAYYLFFTFHLIQSFISKNFHQGTVQKMKFSINDFFSKCDQNFIFCAVKYVDWFKDIPFFFLSKRFKFWSIDNLLLKLSPYHYLCFVILHQSDKFWCNENLITNFC